MRHENGKMKKILFIQIGIGVILIALLVLMFFWLKGDFIGYKPKKESVQYVYGRRIENSSSVEFTMKEDGIVGIKDGENENSLYNQPIIYENPSYVEKSDQVSDEEQKADKKDNGGRKDITPKEMKSNELTITSDMIYSDPKFAAPAYRLNYFTTLVNDGGTVTISADGKEATVPGGYLYDGDNLYIFLEKATLHIGDRVVELGPLSYISVEYRFALEYYNSIDGEYKYMSQGDLDVWAEVDGKYIINLNNDILEKKGETMLIFTQVQLLDVMPMN